MTKNMVLLTQKHIIIHVFVNVLQEYYGKVRVFEFIFFFIFFFFIGKKHVNEHLYKVQNVNKPDYSNIANLRPLC